VIDVLSSDAVRIHAGDAVLFEQWGGDRPLAGTVRLIVPSVLTKVSALGVDEAGLRPGALVVTHPSEQLREGARVSLP